MAYMCMFCKSKFAAEPEIRAHVIECKLHPLHTFKNAVLAAKKMRATPLRDTSLPEVIDECDRAIGAAMKVLESLKA